MKLIISSVMALSVAMAVHASNYTLPESYSDTPDRQASKMVHNWNLDREAISATSLNLPTNIAGTVTDNPQQATAFDNAWNALLGGAITNVSADLYATYAPKAPAGQAKFGGGLFVAYNFNQYVGAGVGLDWLNQFALISVNMSFEAPIHLTTIVPLLANVTWLQNVEIVPFTIVGLATPYSGNGKFNGSPMAVSDVGGYVAFGHLWGGQFNAGLAWGQWAGEGPWGNVVRYHGFAGYTKSWGK